MRLYGQELKRILKSARARVVILLAVILPVFMAVLASEFNDADYDKRLEGVRIQDVPAESEIISGYLGGGHEEMDNTEKKGL